MPDSKMGQWTRQMFKRLVVTRDGSKCGICLNEIDMSLRDPHPDSWSLDHLVPRSRGGNDELENLIGSHRVCNRWKSDKLFEELDFSTCPR